jgi:DNA ligase-1
MQRCQSELMSEDGEPDFTFWVFDFWTVPKMPYSSRWTQLYGADFEGYFFRYPRVRLLSHMLFDNNEQLEAYSSELLTQGYEGTMIRSVDGPYKYGRSTEKEGYLRKIKPWETSEAVVIGFIEQYHNSNEATTDARGNTKRSHHQENMVPMGTLGSFQLRDIKTGVEFDCGTGPILTKEGRQHYWNTRESLQGAILTYKHFSQTGVKDKPRFPTATAFRDKRDM